MVSPCKVFNPILVFQDVETVRNNLRLAVSEFSEQELTYTTRRSFTINGVEATFRRTTTDSGQFELRISINRTYSIYLRMPPDRYIPNIRSRLLTLATQWRPDRWNGISIQLDGLPGAAVSTWNTGVDRTRLSTVSEEAASSHVYAAQSPHDSSSRIDAAATPLAPLAGVSSSSSGRPISHQAPAVHGAGIEQTIQQGAPVGFVAQGTPSQTHHVRSNSYDPFEIHQRTSLDGRPSQDRNAVDSSRQSSESSSRPSVLSSPRNQSRTWPTPNTSVQGTGSSSMSGSQFSQLLDGSGPSDMSSQWGSSVHTGEHDNERNSLGQGSGQHSSPPGSQGRASLDSNPAGTPSSQPHSTTSSRRSERSNSFGQRSNTSGQHPVSPGLPGSHDRTSLESADGYPSYHPPGYLSNQTPSFTLNEPRGQGGAFSSPQNFQVPRGHGPASPTYNPRSASQYPAAARDRSNSSGVVPGHHPVSAEFPGRTSFGNPGYPPTQPSRNYPPRSYGEYSNGENSD